MQATWTDRATTVKGAEAAAAGTRRARDATAALDALAQLSVPALDLAYASARVPMLDDVRGPLRGRMLAWPVLTSVPGADGAIRALAAASWFPWLGKSFSSSRREGAPSRRGPAHDDRGQGVNRIIRDRWELFRFDTFIAPSRAGDFDALHLDYDHADNPPPIRHIEDEIREVEPGVWLGHAYFVTSSSATLVLYFALAAV